MKIFLSWSGDRSRAVATALRDWLPKVIQAVQPWLSSADIDKGTRWATEVASQLQDIRLGIICLTPENLAAPWLLFEAGALSKTLAHTYVCTYLVGLEPSDLSWPLAMFQATKANKEETRKLLHTINKALDADALTGPQLDETVEVWWPHFESALSAALAMPAATKVERPDRELLEELISLSRAQMARFEQTGPLDMLSPDARLALLSGTHHTPPSSCGVNANSRVEPLGRFEASTVLMHGAPADYAASRRFEWHGMLPPPGACWAYSKGELDYLLAGGRIMLMNNFPVLRLFSGDRAALEQQQHPPSADREAAPLA